MPELDFICTLTLALTAPLTLAIYEMTDITASIFTDDTLDAILTSETLAAAMELDALGNIKQLNTLASALLGTEAVGMPLLELLPVGAPYDRSLRPMPPDHGG